MEKQKQNQPPKEIVKQSKVGEAIKLFLRYELGTEILRSISSFVFCNTERVSVGKMNENIANKNITLEERTEIL